MGGCGEGLDPSRSVLGVGYRTLLQKDGLDAHFSSLLVLDLSLYSHKDINLLIGTPTFITLTKKNILCCEIFAIPCCSHRLTI